MKVEKGEMILKAKATMMSDEDWNLVKDTKPAKLYYFGWMDNHAIPLGKWKFDFYIHVFS